MSTEHTVILSVAFKNNNFLLTKVDNSVDTIIYEY